MVIHSKSVLTQGAVKWTTQVRFSILRCPGWRDLAYRSDQPRIGPGTEMGAVVGDFTGPHMACYGSDPSSNSVTFSWGSLTLRAVFHDADKFYVPRDHGGSSDQDWNDKGATKDCLGLPWCNSQAFNIDLSIMFLYFHAFSWWKQTLRTARPAMSLKWAAAEWHDFDQCISWL